MSAVRPRKTAKNKAGRAVRVKRVYEQAAEDDGLRVLVDRLWPRGFAKNKAHIDEWLKDVAPSDLLRKRFHGNPAEWAEFVAAYRRELAREPGAAALGYLRALVRKQPVTLLYAARDETHNNAVALKQLLGRKNKA
jgi:uncharacterized protein YeaO (DUF488 family)